MSDVAVLVPRRPDGGRRDELWAFCEAWWRSEHPDLEIIEGHHTQGRFNRSAALNSAAARTDADILIAADGDVIVPPTHLEEAIKIAAETGRAVLPYGHGGYTPLNATMTDKVLAGYDGRWDTPQGVSRGDASPNHVSSCVVVPRALWERVGGYDERVSGWGPEDRLFHLTLRVLGGGVGHVPGQVFHLHHPFSSERNGFRGYAKDLDWLAAKSLWDHAATLMAPADMERFVNDRRSTDGVLLVYVTNGRAECLSRAVTSFTERVDGPVMRRVIVDDSGDPDYQAWIRYTFPDHELMCTKGRTGFDGAYRKVWGLVVWYGLPWAFVIEDDFTAERTIDLRAMQATMLADPNLVQMALRRQAWFPGEIKAGGVIELNPDGYTDTVTHLEHREFVTTNPALWSRDFVVHNPWPTGPHSESRFAQQAFKDPDARAGYWGQRTDAPWVIHDGERQGTGY